MSATALALAIIPLASEVLKLIGTNEAKKFLVEMIDLERKRKAHLRLPLDKQNDSYVEKLDDEIANIARIADIQYKQLQKKDTA